MTHPGRLGALIRGRTFRFVLVLAILALLLSRVDRAILFRHLASLDLPVLAGMVGINGIQLLVCSWRWSSIGSVAGFPAPLSAFVRATWLSWAAAELGPSLLVGEWARFRTMRAYANPVQLAVSQFVDRLSAYLGLVVLAAASIAWLPPEGGVKGVNAVFLLLAVCILGLSMTSALLWRFRTALDKDRGSLEILRTLLIRPSHYGLSLVANALFAGNFALAAQALGFGVSVWNVLCMAPLVLLGAGSLPSLVSDWGKREAAAVVALAEIGLGPEQSLAVSLVYGGVNLVSALPGWLVLLYADRTGLERLEKPDFLKASERRD